MKKSLLITITSVCIAISGFAQTSLPTSWDFSTTILPTNWTSAGGFTYYPAAGSPAPAAKFQATADMLTIFFSSTPGNLVYDISGNAFSGGTFLVEESANGTIWTTLHTFTTPPTIYTTMTDIPNSASRYIRFNYSNKVAGNIGLDNVSISPLFTPCSIATVTYGSQTYNTVLIGTQCWFHENLNIGTEVADVTVQSNNSIIEKTCYNASTSDCGTYGGIYTWDEALNYTTGSQGICPNGWHIPTQAEWQALITFLGATNAGQQMKVTASNIPAWDGTNTSGFAALSGGIGQGTSFLFQGTRETFWSSTEFSSTDAYNYDLTLGGNTLDEYNNTKPSGYCVRCLQDVTTGIYSPIGALNYFSIYPNPAQDFCEIALELNSDAVVKLSICNVLGEQVILINENTNFSTGRHNFNINTSELVNGIYFINLNVDGKSSIKKMVKLN